MRDLAGLIVIDFIDMDEKRNNRAVERRLKECLKHDRARIQVGRISHFGLLEMSRQRLRTSVLESSTEKCPYCGGSGHVRSVSSLALQVLRALEEQLIRGATHNLTARTRPDVALYVLNQKRAHLRSLEERFAITITVTADETVRAPQTFVIDRGEQVHTIEAAKALAERAQAQAAPLEEEDDLEDFSIVEEEDTQAEVAVASTAVEHGEGGSRRRRRRRRRGGRDGGDHPHGPSHGQAHGQSHGQSHGRALERVEHIPIGEPTGEPGADEIEIVADESMIDPTGGLASESHEQRADDHSERGEPRRDERRRRRGRRGGRRNRQRNDESGYAGREQSGPSASQEFAPTEQLTAPPAPEPELRHAIADLDSPVERATPPDASPAAEPSEPARRRSTVREPAPGGEVPANNPGQTVSESSEPVITETGNGAESERPRRTGWWSRRFAGS